MHRANVWKLHTLYKVLIFPPVIAKKSLHARDTQVAA
jgi:hypothetical protein